MELLVAADAWLFKTEDGKYWCRTIYGYEFWKRYLNGFDKVAVVARTRISSYKAVQGYLRVDGPNVRIIELPYLRGMKEYLLNFFPFRRAAKKAVLNADHALFRLPSVSAFMVLSHYKKKNKPYLIEVVADPFDAYSSNKIAKYLYSKSLRKAALEANGVSYVTEYYLQNKYPSRARLYGETENYFETHYSTIDLDDSYFSTLKHIEKGVKDICIIHVANSINNDKKGHDTVLKVSLKLKEIGYNPKVYFIGDGTQRQYYESLAEKMGLKENTVFTGLLSSSYEVRDYLLKGDIFLFPSKAEGLPRVLIEAMALGLPSLSTPINGIPELLNEEFLFDSENIEGFVNKITEIITDPLKYNQISQDNLTKASEYLNTKLDKRRLEFYMKLKNLN